MSAQTSLLKGFRMNLQVMTMLMAVVFLWVFFAIMTGGAYVTPQALSNLFRQMTIISFMACGMVLVIVTGGIDLSVGKVAGFVSVVAAALQAWFWPSFLGNLLPGVDPATRGIISSCLTVVLSLGTGIVVGMLQGGIIAYLGVPSFIVTLGGMFIFNGAILAVTKGQTIPANQPSFSVIGQGYLPDAAGYVIAAIAIAATAWLVLRGRRKRAEYGNPAEPLWFDLIKIIGVAVVAVGYVVIVNFYQGFQMPVLIMVVVALIMAYVSNCTRFGRYAYAIGGNKEAARLSGINIKKSIFSIFVLMGGLCGVAGTSLASYVGYGTIAAGQGYELDVIASCILGGTSTLGGEGTIIGALLGALIMTSLTTGMTMMNAAPAMVYIVKGLVFILAVLVDVMVRKSSAKA